MTNEATASVLSDAEMAAIEQQMPQAGNAALNSLFENYGAERLTSRGHKIISSRIFNKMLKEGIPFDQEHIYMMDPSGSVAAVPARKHVKYFGEGRRLVEDKETEPQTPSNTKESVTIDGKTYNLFFCETKYPDCKRFFDTARGRDMHWKAEHEKAWSRKAKKDA